MTYCYGEYLEGMATSHEETGECLRCGASEEKETLQATDGDCINCYMWRHGADSKRVKSIMNEFEAVFVS